LRWADNPRKSEYRQRFLRIQGRNRSLNRSGSLLAGKPRTERNAHKVILVHLL